MVVAGIASFLVGVLLGLVLGFKLGDLDPGSRSRAMGIGVALGALAGSVPCVLFLGGTLAAHWRRTRLLNTAGIREDARDGFVWTRFVRLREGRLSAYGYGVLWYDAAGLLVFGERNFWHMLGRAAITRITTQGSAWRGRVTLRVEARDGWTFVLRPGESWLWWRDAPLAPRLVEELNRVIT